MNHLEGRFAGRGGLRIYWQAWLATTPRQAAVVIAHGLGEHGGRYARVAQTLVDRGLAVYAIDHHGHGHSEGRRAKLERLSHAVDDLDVVVELARKGEPPLPVFLLGHSMGGAIAVAYALKFQHKLAGLVLSGPAVSVEGAPWIARAMSKALTNVLPNAGVFQVDPALVSRDADEVRAYEDDPLNLHGKAPLRTIAELVKASEWLPKAMDQLRLPLLAMQGGDDALVPVSAARMVHERVSSEDKTLHVFDGLYHEIFNELPPDRERVLAILAGWLETRIPA